MKRESTKNSRTVFPPEFLDTLRKTVNIEKLVGEYIPLKKQSSGSVGLCPFHEEKTPSFHVSTAKGIYHCFGCKNGSDAIGFLINREGYSFFEAVRFLADK
jgi:DNA primase